jgi:5-deoxy-glucuronate isomerase
MWTKDELQICPQPPDAEGRIHHVTPETAKWEYTSFDVYRIGPGQRISGRNDGKEICAVVISGAALLSVDGDVLGKTGSRLSPFDGRPWAFYAPLDSSWEIMATEPLEVAVCGAPARSRKTPYLIRPGDFPIETRGTGSNIRHVIDLLPANQDLADRLLVVEALTPPGNSSSYPPHKHDVDNLPFESKLEEIYYHRINPPQGFAFQRIYTDDRSLDVVMAVNDRDVVLVPKGYHPVAAPHGYELYYLNVMAGPNRIWKTNPDPDHAWLLSVTDSP